MVPPLLCVFFYYSLEPCRNKRWRVYKSTRGTGNYINLSLYKVCFLNFSPRIMPCIFVCVLSPVLVSPFAWNTLSLKPMLFSFVVVWFSSAKSAAGSTCGMLSSSCFCGANTFVYHFSYCWLKSGAGGQGPASEKPLTLSTFICRSDSGGTDLHFSLIYTHTWKYMLILCFVKPRNKLPVSGTWLFNWFQLCTLISALCFFFSSTCFWKVSFIGL